MMANSGRFTRFANAASRFAGSPASFMLAILVVLAWIVTGPIFGFSDTWQLVINTGTTVVTFLMVFLIQNSQNRDGKALQIKLDELIRATRGAHNVLLDLEELDEKDLQELKDRYEVLARRARECRPEDADDNIDNDDTGSPDVDSQPRRHPDQSG